MTDVVQEKVPVYFIGVDYPADIGTLSYNVRGKSYQVPRNKETGAPEIGGALMADPNDVNELISKARYFNGKVNVEVFTTDANLAASVTAAFKRGTKAPIEARLVGAGIDVVVAPSKDEIIQLMSDAELVEILKKRGQQIPESLSNATAEQTAPNADVSANARAKAVKAAEAKKKAEDELAAKLEG